MANPNRSQQPLTQAGAEMLSRYLAREIAGHLVDLIHFSDRSSAGKGMPLRHGSGQDLACAQKLSRDGYVRLIGQRHRRFVTITDQGRVAVESQA